MRLVVRDTWPLCHQTGEDFLVAQDGMSAQVLEALLGAQPGGTLQLDFTGIQDCTWKAVQALSTELLMTARRAGAFIEDRRLLYINVGPDLQRALAAALHSATAPLALPLASASFRGVIGPLPEHLHALLSTLYSTPAGLTASELEELGVKAASRKLHALIDGWPEVVRRQQETGRGVRAWTYRHLPVLY